MLHWFIFAALFHKQQVCKDQELGLTLNSWLFVLDS